ncbi:hypothetical protein [Chondromyces crocatus]|uniref:hypothetical protein n=1 Tax=Chondromyces crocatus TaxID=52 RepID=UPI00067D2ADA|nr:hypothetical protein [Chondromyces crocatus]
MLGGVAVCSIGLLALGSVGCGRPVAHVLADLAVSGASHPTLPRPDALSESARAAGYRILGGDLHCHVRPPDGYPHVSRTVAETVALAREEKLDFVVLTPHLRAGFFLDEGRRAVAIAQQRTLAEEVRRAAGSGPVFVVGFEYTDFTYGHLGASFGDLEAVLAAVPVHEAQARPGRFFDEYVRRGGFLVINHPLLVPLDTLIPWARYDMSWQPFTRRMPEPFPDEIMTAGRLAQGIEVFNLAVSEMRDRLMLFDRHHSLREAMRLVDWQITLRPRRFVPVGGSDSHSAHLRATTFVLASARTPESIRDALRAGRVCVREPAACSLEARGEGTAGQGSVWSPVGSSLHDVHRLVVRTRGERARILLNGRALAPEGPGRDIEVTVDPRWCSVVRAEVDGGYSAPIYVNCGDLGGDPLEPPQPASSVARFTPDTP